MLTVPCALLDHDLQVDWEEFRRGAAHSMKHSLAGERP